MHVIIVIINTRRGKLKPYSLCSTCSSYGGCPWKMGTYSKKQQGTNRQSPEFRVKMSRIQPGVAPRAVQQRWGECTTPLEQCRGKESKRPVIISIIARFLSMQEESFLLHRFLCEPTVSGAPGAGGAPHSVAGAVSGTESPTCGPHTPHTPQGCSLIPSQHCTARAGMAAIYFSFLAGKSDGAVRWCQPSVPGRVTSAGQVSSVLLLQ